LRAEDGRTALGLDYVFSSGAPIFFFTIVHRAPAARERGPPFKGAYTELHENKRIRKVTLPPIVCAPARVPSTMTKG
jgi:hypothetical protein